MRIEPDFVEWSKHILDRDELAEALKTAYAQGYSAGYIDREINWFAEQDAEHDRED